MRVIIDPPPPGGTQAEARTLRAGRYKPGTIRMNGVDSIYMSGTGGSQITPPGEFAATGEKMSFQKVQGFIMSRGPYDKSAEFNPSGSFPLVDGMIPWWDNNRQLEFKKGTFLKDVVYGQTGLGNIMDRSPKYSEGLIAPADDLITQWNKLTGKIVINQAQLQIPS